MLALERADGGPEQPDVDDDAVDLAALRARVELDVFTWAEWLRGVQHDSHEDIP